eukprot:TRINITY_DN32273_c0_g1_i1.p1 TRINITY_DN32273_c0_g1~~TRINITY_DN32273_c0_g1_i1.p1  ORF type:complete len:523 (+),score=142.92 TRINITY_DN32273_c0_g1_i1:53-1621(+)
MSHTGEDARGEVDEYAPPMTNTGGYADGEVEVYANWAVCASIWADVAVFSVPERYEVRGTVGDGAYGVVAWAHDRVTDDCVAIKKVEGCYRNLREAKKLVREVRLLKHFAGHPNIVNLHGLLFPQKQDIEDGTIYIATELLQTDLKKVFANSRGMRLSTAQCQHLTRQILNGVAALHQAHVIHRDIKPANIFIGGEGGLDVKIGDFGLARDGTHSFKTYKGIMTRLYRPPELSEMFSGMRYGYGVDVWSVGCVFAEMLSREKQPLFSVEQGVSQPGPQQQILRVLKLIGAPGEQDIEQLEPPPARARIRDDITRHDLQPTMRDPRLTKIPGLGPAVHDEGYWPASRQDEAVDFLKAMLAFSPATRLCAEELLRHPYLQLHADEADGDDEKEDVDDDDDGDSAERQQTGGTEEDESDTPIPVPPHFDASFEDHMTSVGAVREMMNVMIAHYHPSFPAISGATLHPSVQARTEVMTTPASQPSEAYYCVDDHPDDSVAGDANPGNYDSDVSSDTASVSSGGTLD